MEKVLCIDDDLSLLRLYQEELVEEGYKVVLARDGREGLAKFEKEKPNVVIMDIRMPVLSGYEATAFIKADEQMKHIPVVMLTASVMKEQEDEVKQDNFDGFLRKPVNRIELIAQLMRFLPHSIRKKTRETVETGEKKEPETISRETQSQLPQILGILENRFTGEWKRVSEVFILDDVETFALGIINLGNQYRLSLLSQWGEKLLKEIRSYDMENSPITLASFPELVKKINVLAGMSSNLIH